MSEHPHIGRFFSAEDEACLSMEDMQAYAAGQLSSERRHAVERHLLNCELCSLAYEGLVEEDPAEVEAAVEFLTTEAWNRVEAREKRKRRGVYWWMSGAAVAIILIVVGYFSLDRQNSENLDQLAADMLKEGREFAEAETPTSKERGKRAEEELPPPPPESNEPADFNGSFHGNAQHSLPTNAEETLAEGELNDAANKDFEVIERPDADVDQLDFEALDPVEDENRPVLLNQDGKPQSRTNLGTGAYAEGKKDLAKDVEKNGVEGLLYASPDLNNSSTGYITPVPAGNAVTGVNATSPAVTGGIAPNAPLFGFDSTMVDKEALDRSLNRRDSLSLDKLALAEDAEYKSGEDFDDFGAGDFQLEVAEEMDFAEEEEVFEVEDAMVEPLQEKNEVVTKLQDTRTIAGDEISIVGGVTGVNTSGTRKKERNRSGKAKRSADVAGVTEQQDIPIPDAYRQGVEQFRRQEFSNAASSLRQAVSETPNNLEAHLLAARSFLEINQPSAALFHLNRILAQQDTGLHQDANWYKSIAHLQMGEKEKARAVLEKIKAEGGKWKRPASEALNKF